MITEEDFLAHFGVKGMRWGHRKREESGGNEGNSNAPTVSSSKRGRIVGENNRDARKGYRGDNDFKSESI